MFNINICMYLISITITFANTYIFNEKNPKVKNKKYFDHR